MKQSLDDTPQARRRPSASMNILSVVRVTLILLAWIAIHSLLASVMVCRAGHLEVILKLRIRCIYICTGTATGFQASRTVCMRSLQNMHLAC